MQEIPRNIFIAILTEPANNDDFCMCICYIQLLHLIRYRVHYKNKYKIIRKIYQMSLDVLFKTDLHWNTLTPPFWLAWAEWSTAGFSSWNVCVVCRFHCRCCRCLFIFFRTTGIISMKLLAVHKLNCSPPPELFIRLEMWSTDLLLSFPYIQHKKIATLILKSYRIWLFDNADRMH